MGATIKPEPWMFAAAREWMKRSTGVNRDSYESQQLAEVIASHAPSDGKNAESLIWAVERWNLEVRNRPIKNVHYRTLDETWRQVMCHFGGDPDELVGPPPQYSAPSEAAAQPTSVAAGTYWWCCGAKDDGPHKCNCENEPRLKWKG